MTRRKSEEKVGKNSRNVVSVWRQKDKKLDKFQYSFNDFLFSCLITYPILSFEVKKRKKWEKKSEV
jgi:hypothetical protein